MKKQFVTYEIALALKELGFNAPCMALYYIEDKCFHKTNYTCTNVLQNNICLDAPLWQQVIDWFREEHDIWIEVPYDYTKAYNSYYECLSELILYYCKKLK